MLDLDIGHLDTPGVGLLIENLLNIGVEPIAFRQQFIELVFAEDRTQRGLRGRTSRACPTSDSTRLAGTMGWTRRRRGAGDVCYA